MEWKTSYTLALVVVAIITAGCSSSPQYNEVYFAGYPEADGGTLQLKGSVSAGKGAVPHQNFSNVRVALYDENQDALTSITVGNLSTNAGMDLIQYH